MPLQVHIYLLCYNESALIGHTIDHYLKRFKNTRITILDNESTDGSVEIAKSKGCEIRSWSSDNNIDDQKFIDMKNNVWKEIDQDDKNQWTIVADMDEWLCISEEELEEEHAKGTTILSTIGYNIVADSKTEDLSDLDLHSLNRGLYWKEECKSLCFKPSEILEMNYEPGAHICAPIGNIRYSEKTYVIKHMEPLGLPFCIAKYTSRYKRTEKKRLAGEWWAGLHYTDDLQKIEERFIEQHNGAVSIAELVSRKTIG
jgi:hypothetical protein